MYLFQSSSGELNFHSYPSFTASQQSASSVLWRGKALISL
uniref:Uncharacterized protein n=1 Tax=Arundo donax TaxID=35708 RepID=A0A0A9C2K4_ARUDO